MFFSSGKSPLHYPEEEGLRSAPVNVAPWIRRIRKGTQRSTDRVRTGARPGWRSRRKMIAKGSSLPTRKLTIFSLPCLSHLIREPSTPKHVNNTN